MARRRFPLKLALCFALFALFAGRTVDAQYQSQTISLNGNRLDIEKIIQQVGEATGRTILYDDSVRGVVSIVAKRPVSLEEAWALLGAALNLRGYTLLPSTVDNWRVSKVADAVGEAPFVRELSSRGESYVTTLIPLRMADPEVVMAALQPLAGASVTLVPFTRTNSLIASGPERRIARLTSIADSLDQVDEHPLRFKVLRYRSVAEIEGWIGSLFRIDMFKETELEIWTDERTNSLIYRATDDAAERLLGYVETFDRPLEGGGQIQVLRILNRDAEEVAEVIRSLRDSPAQGERPTTFRNFTELARNEYSIAVDTVTRSLIVRAASDAQRTIRKLVETIDEPPQLIAVDLKVTEIRTPRSFSLGFAFNVPLSTGDSADEVVARLVSTPGGTGLAATPSPETTIFSRVDQSLNVPFTFDDGTGIAIPIANTGVINAGELSARTEILIEPSLIVTAGDSHEIFVGFNVPLPVTANGTGADATNTSNVANALSRTITFERRDIGIKVGIEATASRVGPIALNLDVELSQLAQSIAGDIELVGPTFVEQQFVVNAVLDDGEAAIVALNRSKRKTESRAGTPFLSSIPVLGQFFTQSGEREENVHLVVAAQVRRIGSPAELAADSIRRRLAFERRNAREASLPIVSEGEPGFAVLVTTRSFRDDATAIADGLEMRGFATEIHSWKSEGGELFDVYVTSLESMSAAAEVASILNEEGWQTDLMVLPTRS